MALCTDKSLHVWLVWTLPLNNVASNVFGHKWSDLSSDMCPSVNALLAMTSPSEFTGSHFIASWLDQQQLNSSWSYYITSSSSDIKDPPTSVVATVGFRASISLISVFLVVLCVLGLLFNGFVLAVLIYAKQWRRLNCNLYIINQSLADFMSCLSTDTLRTSGFEDNEFRPSIMNDCVWISARFAVWTMTNGLIGQWLRSPHPLQAVYSWAVCPLSLMRWPQRLLASTRIYLAQMWYA